MRYNDNYKKQWMNGGNGKTVLVLLLIFAFPLGLAVLWRESDLHNTVKVAITAFWGAVVCAFIVVLCVTTVEYDEGNIISSSVNYD